MAQGKRLMIGALALTSAAVVSLAFALAGGASTRPTYVIGRIPAHGVKVATSQSTARVVMTKEKRELAAQAGACSSMSAAALATQQSALLTSQQTHQATIETPTGTTYVTPFVYKSLPLDVAGTGTYFFDFGPIPSSFKWGQNVVAYGVSQPQDFTGFSTSSPVPASPQVVSIDGASYFDVPVLVSDATCSGLQLWISG